MIGDRRVRRGENLDVAGTSQNQENGLVKGKKGKSGARPHLCSLCAPGVCAPAAQRLGVQRDARRYRLGGTRLITIAQAGNIIEAVEFARSVSLAIGRPSHGLLGFTNAGDDPDGKLFAAVREGL